MTGKTPRAGFQPRDWLEDKILGAGLALARVLPYRRRVPVMGWLMSRIVAPLAGQRRRIRANLGHVCPDLPAPEVARLCRAVPDNIGRTMAEMFSPDGLAERARQAPLTGPGVATLQAARDAGAPVVLVTGHLGNYDVARAALHQRGYRIGALYRPMRNRYFNARYLRAIGQIDTPLFARDRRGLSEMVRFLREGGMLAILVDQRIAGGAPLRFFGAEARTALSAAELALKMDAPLVPGYAIRQPDGLSFRLVAEAPVARGTAEDMTQALNDSLEAQVRTHMDQWLWTHRRWRVPRQRSRAAASIGP